MSQRLACQVQIKFQIASVRVFAPSLIVMSQFVEGVYFEIRNLFRGEG